MSKNVTEFSAKDCGLKAKSFQEVYKIPTTIKGVNFNDENWDWDKVITVFNDKYVLTEYYKPGKDNSTDYVILSYRKDGVEQSIRFDKYQKAELALVDIMKGK